MRIDAATVITDEDRFLRVNILRARGNPDSAVTKAAIKHLEQYCEIKNLQLCKEQLKKQKLREEASRLNSQKQSKPKTDQSQMKLL